MIVLVSLGLWECIVWGICSMEEEECLLGNVDSPGSFHSGLSRSSTDAFFSVGSSLSSSGSSATSFFLCFSPLAFPSFFPFFSSPLPSFCSAFESFFVLFCFQKVEKLLALRVLWRRFGFWATAGFVGITGDSLRGEGSWASL